MPPKYKQISRLEVPIRRNGKHHGIVARILGELEDLKGGMALKLPLKELPDTKENIRSALNRASRKAKLKVATAADDRFLYIWNGDLEKP